MTVRASTRPLSRNVFAGQGNAALPRFPVGTKVIIIGDSITQMNHWASATKVSSRGSGYMTWALADIPAFQHLIWYDATPAPDFYGANFGIDGDTATGIAARTTPMINSGAQLAVLLCGTNVGATDALPSTVIGKIKEILADLHGAGMHVILGTIWPREVAESPTGSQISPASMARIISINNAIRAMAADNVTIWDAWPDMVDPQYNQSNLYGTARSGFLYDSVHPSARGAYAASRSLNKLLKGMVENDQYSSTWFNSDPTDAANRLLDGALAGSGGTASNGMTGTVATNWVASCASASGNVSGVASVSANSDTGGQTQTLVLTSDGLGSATGQELTTYTPTGFRVNEPAMTVGNWTQLFYKVRVRNNTDGVLGSLYCEHRNTVTGVFGYGMEFRNGTNAQEPWPTGDFDAWLISQPVQYTVSNANTFIPRLCAQILEGIAGSVTIHIDCALLLEVDPPSTTFPYVT